MHQLTFYFDVISPYAYLAFDQLPRSLQGLSYQVRYQPVLFGGLLKHHGQLGPVEVVGKREWTYRQSLWLARQQGLELQLPAAHPFNPLPLLRLAAACDPNGHPSRQVCEAVFKHVWCGGLDPTDPNRLADLTQRLQPARSPEAEDVKASLRHGTEQAIADGVFGVPSIRVDQEVFWGLDALPMLREYLDGDDWYRSPGWTSAVNLPEGIRRKR